MSVKTVKVSNVSHKASELELKEFFSFSGDIAYVETKSEDEETLTAYVTFKDSQGAETAVMLTGATIVDKTVSISLDPDYEMPPEALNQASEGQNPPSALRKAEDVVSSMLAKGFILGKDAVGKAKSLDEKHQLTSTASLKIASLDQKIGFTEKISIGTSAVNNKVKEIDEKFQVSEKTKSAFAVAEEKVSNAGSAVMKNRYILTGATWVTGAFNKVTKAAGEVGEKTKEKLGMVDDEQKRKVVDDFAQVHLSESDSPKAVALEASSTPKESVQIVQRPTNPEPAQGEKCYRRRVFSEVEGPVLPTRATTILQAPPLSSPMIGYQFNRGRIVGVTAPISHREGGNRSASELKEEVIVVIDEEKMKAVAESCKECVVCLDEFRDEEEEIRVRVLQCGHKFHEKCINSWFLMHPSCPLCRNFIPNSVETTC